MIVNFPFILEQSKSPRREMRRRNQSLVTEFILIGFPIAQQLQVLFFVFLLNIYLLTVTGNVIIIYIVKQCPHLHRPMYYLLINFSFMEICYTSSTVPKMMGIFFLDNQFISIVGCITQCYFVFVMGGMENYLLALMAYDRYLAICHPLRYPAIMTTRLCCMLTAGCWLATFVGSILPTIYISRLSYCGPNEINHFFCDISPLLEHSCTDTTFVKQYFFIIIWIVIFSCAILTLISYVSIIWAIMKISSTNGRQRAFSTCTAHVTVVAIYYGTVIFVYVRPTTGDSLEVDKMVSVFYMVITPLFNPFIYSLRNKEVKEALIKYFGNYITFTRRSSLCCGH
ncbi:olfactory receptor 6F1-like [Pleurodeles waltl]|uniref:olfactory receptor 6F1-like n=1 Tax=Pleurodeles waltl TaxID=8319 RepID=UPI003709AECD